MEACERLPWHLSWVRIAELGGADEVANSNRCLGTWLRQHADGYLLGDDSQPITAVYGRNTGRERLHGGLA